MLLLAAGGLYLYSPPKSLDVLNDFFPGDGGVERVAASVPFMPGPEGIRTTLGEDAFWSGLRRYTRGHAGGPVTSIDLERAMEATSRRDLHPLFYEWVFGPGSASK